MTSSSLSSDRTKKRKKSSDGVGNSIFSAVSRLESEDVRASKVRRSLNQKAVAQSQAAQSQANLQGQFVECRIILQKVLQSSSSTVLGQNKKSVNKNNSDDSDSSDDDDEDDADDALKAKCISSCDDVLAHLLEARRQLCGNVENDDEDDDDEEDNKYHCIMKEDEQSNSSSSSSSNSSKDDLEDLLEEEYKECQVGWKEVLNRRHADLQLSSGLKTAGSKQFRVMDQSFWDQWTEYLQSQQRWTTTGNTATDSKKEEGDGVLWYDDSKMYQHMLKDFISQQTNNNSSATTSMAEAAAQRLARKQKKRRQNSSKNVTIDRRASKGRKIRYVVHDKLVHFTFPTSRPIPTIPEDDWFRSLFGGIANRPKK